MMGREINGWKILKKYYKGRDESHGWGHVQEVALNALYIARCEYINNDRDKTIIVVSALGHDIWDHKYIDPRLERIIKRMFNTDLQRFGLLAADRDLITRIIDCISYSKESEMRKNGKSFDLEVPEEKLRNIVSDADKLEALGEVCIRRMIEYEIKKKNSTTIEDHMAHIKQHCNEKLYLLIDQGYFKTEIGKQLAEPLMTELKEVVDDDLKLVKFIKDYLKGRTI